MTTPPAAVSRRGVLRAAAGALALAAIVTTLTAPRTTRPAYAAFNDDLPQLSTPAVAGSEVFARGADGTLLYASARPATGAYDPFVSLGGQITGDPSAVTTADTVVVARGTDGQIRGYLRPANGTAFSIGTLTGFRASDDPVAVSRFQDGVPVVQVFARGVDGTVSTNTFAGGVWSGWYRLGDFIVTSNITPKQTDILFDDNGRPRESKVQLLARGSDGRVFTTRVSGAAPYQIDAWTPLGDLRVSSDISIANPGRIPTVGDRVVARGVDNAIWVYAFGVGSSAGVWQSLGGALTSDPAAVGSPDGTLFVYGRGTDNALYVNSLPPPPSAPAWTGWQILGSQVAGNPAAVAGSATFRSRVLFRTADGALRVNTLVNIWSGFLRVDGQLADYQAAPPLFFLDKTSYRVGESPVYTLYGLPPNQPIYWSSTRNGVSTGEVDSYYGQVTNADGYWSGAAGAWQATNVGSWTKTIRVSNVTLTFAFTVTA